MANLVVNAKRKGPLAPEVRHALIQDIKRYFNTGRMRRGIYMELGQKHNVTDITVAKICSEVAALLPLESVNEAKVTLGDLRDELVQEAKVMVENSFDEEEKRKNMLILDRMIGQKIDFMEKFHIKPKASENIVIDAQIEHKVNEDFLQSIAKLE